jgi:class 3 adenylate cyclase
MTWDLVKSCTVAIATPEGDIRGTGFFISPEGHLLTCAHVVEATGGWEQVRVKGQPVRLVYLGDPMRDDFAVFQIPGYQGEAVPLSLLFAPMDRFLSIGYGRPDFPHGASIDGTITDVNPQSHFSNFPMLRLRVEANSQQVQGDYSGSPVFNTGNQGVIGLIAAYDNTQGALAVPLATVLEKWPMLNQLMHSIPVMLPVEPASQSARVFISYRSQDPDLSLAQQFYETLKAAGHEVFMAGNSIRLGQNWPSRIDQELERCNYFVLLLSPQSASSEMVTEEVRRVKQLREAHPEHQPVILPIRVNFPMSSPLNYHLRSYLNQIQQREWNSPADTPRILQEVLSLLEEGKVPDAEESAPVLSTFTAAMESIDFPPSPSANPELPGGQLDLASAFYVERPPIETYCYETIVQPGSLIRIKAPRQMGKTSLMSRILQHAEQQGCRTVALSFQLADGKLFTDLDKFLRWFCANIGRELDLPNRLADYWDDIFGCKVNCKTYFEDYLLKEISSPLVLGLDEVDCIFQYPEIAADFFGMLRAWHEQAKRSDRWKKFRLVMVHSTEVYIPMNINQSPFNVGLPIELPEFTPVQVLDLARRHGLDWKTNQVEQLMAMVGGHPYLVRVALYRIARQDMTLEQLLQAAPTEAGPYGDHLRRHLWNLEQYPGLVAAIRKVVATTEPVRVEAMQAFKLESMGLVRLQGNEITTRFDLYRRYFLARLGSELEERTLELPWHPPEESVLAAIVFTDVVNSTSRLEADEKRTLDLIHRDFQIMTQLCHKFDGKVLKTLGDGLLMYFVSAAKAVECACEIQKVLAQTVAKLSPGEALTHRIGIHFGDVFFSGTDVVGTGVNIAARLQTEAPPGGICISQTVYEVVKNNLSLQVTYMGSRKLKGIQEPLPLYQVTG